jgi:hypothetical protein
MTHEKISAAINSDFVSPEELEAIRNGVRIDSNGPETIPPQNIPQKVIPPPQKQAPTPFQTIDDRPVWGSSSVSSANAQAQAVNKHGGKDQNAGANSYNNNVNNEQGNFHNSGASSIGSNLSEDGKTGQLSASNVQKTTSQTADGFKNSESSQSQSANFDKNTNSLQASDANTNFKHTVDKTGERKEVSSGSSAVNQNQFGTGNSKAQTNTVDYIENGVKGQKTDSNAQSIQINKDGSTSNSHAHAGTNKFKAPDGSEITESKAGSTNVHHGVNGNSGSSAGCNAAGGNQGGNGFSSSYSSSSSSSFTNANGQTVSQSGSDCGTKAGGIPQFYAPGFQPAPFPFPFIG